MNNMKTYLNLSFLVVIAVIAYNSVKNNWLNQDPMVISAIPLLLATLVLWSQHFLLRRRIKPNIKKLMILGVGGLIGIAGFHLYLGMALEAMQLDLVLLFIGGVPLMTLVGALLMGRKTRFRNIFWVFFAFFGVLIINFPMVDPMILMPKTIGIMLLANLCLVFYTLYNEKLALKYNLIEILTIQVTTGTIILYMSLIYKGENLAYELKDLAPGLMDLKTGGSILFIAFFVFFLGYYIYNHALSKVGAVMTALFINLIPVFDMLYKLFLNDDQLRFTGILGSLMVLVSMYMIEDI